MTRDEAIQFIQEVKFAYLATVGSDDAPCVRPVAIKDVYGDDFYFFTFCTTRKVAEMAANPKVEAVWAKVDGASQVRVKGTAHVVEDAALEKRFRADNPMVEKILPQGAGHLFSLYKIVPETVTAAQGLVPYTEIAW
jgi:uncharacterized pyridoxamine 5'-phosphate oxidase family protein